MSRVDRDALKQGLDNLQSQGIIQEWQARPLNMYWIRVLGDVVLRPDAKETAMWVMGAMHGSAMVSAVQKVAGLATVDRDGIARNLTNLQTLGVISSWNLGSDDDYEIRLHSGGKGVFSASVAQSWALGASVAYTVLESESLPEADRVIMEERLDTLKSFEVIEAWASANGQYSVTVRGATSANTRGGKEIDSWSEGALVATLMHRKDGDQAQEEPDHTIIAAALALLTEKGRIRAWSLDEDLDYVIQLQSGQIIVRYAKDMLAWLDGAHAS